jgi:hypothetical protein
VVRYAQTMRDYAKSLNPEVCVEGNGSGITGLNRYFTHGVDPDRMLQVLDVFWDENADAKIEPVPVRPGEPVVFSYPFRSTNLSRKTGKPIIRHCTDARSLCANLTFIGAPGIVAPFGYSEMRTLNRIPVEPGLFRHLQFYKRHEALYRTVLPDNRVGILRNFETLAFNCFDAHHSVAVMEQLLLNRRIGFDILMNSDMETGRFERYKLIILANVTFLSSRIRDRVLKYIARGGALLVTEQTGQYNEEERVRVMPAFQKLFPGERVTGEQRETMDFDAHQQFETYLTAGSPAFTRFGNGKATYLPKVQFAEMVYAGEPPRYNVLYKGVDSRYWREPENSFEILSAIDWLCPDHSPNRLITGHGIFQSNVRWEDGSRGILLFNNRESVATHIPLVLEKAGRVQLFDPKQERVLDLNPAKTKDGFEVIIPSIKYHLMLRWK